MDVNISLDAGAGAIAGIDRTALIADIQAELDKVAAESKSDKTSAVTEAPPSGAQGDAAAIHWLLHIASNPAMAKVYARALVYAINSIVTAVQSKKRGDKEVDFEKRTTKNDQYTINVTILNKEVVLPATTAVIQTWFEGLGGDK